VHERYRQTTDRETDGRQHIAKVNVSSRSLKTSWDFLHRVIGAYQFPKFQDLIDQLTVCRRHVNKYMTLIILREDVQSVSALIMPHSFLWLITYKLDAWKLTLMLNIKTDWPGRYIAATNSASEENMNHICLFSLLIGSKIAYCMPTVMNLDNNADF